MVIRLGQQRSSTALALATIFDELAIVSGSDAN